MRIAKFSVARLVSIASLVSIILVGVSFLTACATQLAVNYDKAIVDGLQTTSVEAMTLFAATATGVSASDFNTRANQYAALIGKLDALAIAAGARPMPKNQVSESINQLLAKRGVAPVSESASSPPSTHAIKKIAETIAKMRELDQKQGLTAYEVIAFKGQASVYFDQAITYENFLQR